MTYSTLRKRMTFVGILQLIIKLRSEYRIISAFVTPKRVAPTFGRMCVGIGQTITRPSVGALAPEVERDCLWRLRAPTIGRREFCEKLRHNRPTVGATRCVYNISGQITSLTNRPSRVRQMVSPLSFSSSRSTNFFSCGPIRRSMS